MAQIVAQASDFHAQHVLVPHDPVAQQLGLIAHEGADKGLGEVRDAQGVLQPVCVF